MTKQGEQTSLTETSMTEVMQKKKSGKFLNQGSGFILWWSVFYLPLCPLTASSIIALHLLEGYSWLSIFSGSNSHKKQNFLSFNSKGRKAQEDCPDSPRPYIYRWARTVRILQRSFVFFQEVRKRKKDSVFIYFLNSCVTLSNKVLNMMRMNTTVL